MESLKTIETNEELLDRVSGEVASKYYIQGYEFMDLKQEAYILGMDVLKKYNPNKGKLEHFVRVALNNSFQNFVKSKTTSKKPCGCLDGSYCSKCKYRESKSRVLQASQYPKDFELSKDTSIRESFVELLPLIDQKLPASMRLDWRKILDDSPVVKSRKLEIFEEIREIVEEYENTEKKKEEMEITFGWESGFFWVETELHLAKLYMDEEAANLWLHILNPSARQVYIKLRSCGTISYNEVIILADSIDENDGWDV